MAKLLLDQFEVDEELAKRDAYGFIKMLREQAILLDE